MDAEFAAHVWVSESSDPVKGEGEIQNNIADSLLAFGGLRGKA